jgi:hypothetical protein
MSGAGLSQVDTPTVGRAAISPLNGGVQACGGNSLAFLFHPRFAQSSGQGVGDYQAEVADLVGQLPQDQNPESLHLGFRQLVRFRRKAEDWGRIRSCNFERARDESG